MIEYLLHVGFLMAVYATVAKSHDLLGGHAGLLSLAHAAFFGIGAYAYALLAIGGGWPTLLAMAAAPLITCVASVLLSIPAVRMGGDSFVLATLAVQMLLWSFAQNAGDLTGGAIGISGIPPLRLARIAIESPFEQLMVACAVLIVGFVVVQRLVSGPYGRVVHAIREDPLLAQSFGKPVSKVIVEICLVSAAICGIAGAVYAACSSHIDPNTFDIHTSIAITAMVLVGGTGRRFGPCVGAVVIVGATECVRFVGLPTSWLGPGRQILYGLLLVTIVVLRPSALYTSKHGGDGR